MADKNVQVTTKDLPGARTQQKEQATNKVSSRASERDYSSAWSNRRSGSKSELKPDIKHA